MTPSAEIIRTTHLRQSGGVYFGLTLREYPGVQWTPPHVLWGKGVLSKG